jgi:translation initiation factor 1
VRCDGGVATTIAMAKGSWQEFSRAESTARPAGLAVPATTRSQQRVRVQRTKAGKGGKLVTAITGLELPEADARTLLKQLKARAGTGGTLKDGVIELQGDQVGPALEALTAAGFRPKQAGG